MRILLLMLLTTTLSFGQMTVTDVEKPETIGKISGLGTTFIELKKSDDVYIMLYRDEKYAHINEYKSFTFDDAEAFYQILLEGIEKKETATKRIELANDILTLEFKKSFGKGIVEIYHNPDKIAEVLGKMQWLDKKRLDKLFGKR